MAVTNVGRVKGSLIYSGPAATDAAIKLEVTAPLDGDMYISTATSNYIYQYAAASTTWVQKASLKGIKGDNGPAGAKGDKGDNGLMGNPGTAAGFGTPRVSVDTAIGTPSVVITATGPDTAKVFNFDFKNLKGATGATGPQGIPGPAGMKGDTGLPGAKGNPGEKGDVGAIGPQGNPGVAGKTPVVTATMNNKGELLIDVA